MQLNRCSHSQSASIDLALNLTSALFILPDANSERNSGRRAAVLEEESKKAQQAQREAEAERRLAERERQERTVECLSWRERHGELAEKFRAQEDLKALRQNKAVRKTTPGTRNCCGREGHRSWC